MHVEFEIEAVGIAGLGEQLLRVLGIVVGRLGRGDAADIGRNADAVEHLGDLAAGNDGACASSLRSIASMKALRTR